MSKFFEHFIYGKPADGSGEYRLMGASLGLTDTNKLNRVIEEYKFWGQQPQNPSQQKIMSLFPCPKDIKPAEDKDYMMFIQVKPKENANRHFYQYHCIFIESDLIANFAFEILIWLTKQPIPVVNKPSKEMLNKIIPIETLQNQLNVDSLKNDHNRAIRLLKNWVDDSNKFSICLSGLLLLLRNYDDREKSVPLVTLPSSYNIAIEYISCISLLLPAIYRNQISIVLGYIDKMCKRADLMVNIVDKIDKVDLSQGSMWLDDKTICVNIEDNLPRDSSKYIQALDKFFSDKPDLEKITQLIHELDDQNLSHKLSGSKITTLINQPEQVLNQIPSLSGNSSLVLKKLREYSREYSDERLVNLVDSGVCNLSLDQWESLESKIRLIQDQKRLDAVIKFLQNLFSENLWNCESISKLEKLKKIKEDPQGVSFAAILDYLQETPDKWEDIKSFAEDVFKVPVSTFKQESSTLQKDPLRYLEFIDALLGCSDSWEQTFSLHVLHQWIEAIIENANLKSEFNKVTTLAWQKVFVSDPQKYIKEIVSIDSAKNQDVVSVLIECLNKLLDVEDKFLSGRLNLLQYVEASSPNNALLINLAKTGLTYHFCPEEWEALLAKEVLLFPSEFFSLIVGMATNCNFNRLRQENYGKFSSECAKEFAAKLTDPEKVVHFLKNIEIINPSDLRYIAQLTWQTIQKFPCTELVRNYMSSSKSYSPIVENPIKDELSNKIDELSNKIDELSNKIDELEKITRQNPESEVEGVEGVEGEGKKKTKTKTRSISRKGNQEFMGSFNTKTILILVFLSILSLFSLTLSFIL